MTGSPRNETVDTRMWLSPHAPPENEVGLSQLSFAQLLRRVLPRQIRNGRTDYAVVGRESHAHVKPYPVHERLGSQSRAPEFRDCARLMRVNVWGSPSAATIFVGSAAGAVGLDGLLVE
jgi:hypothetical protein